MFNKVWVRAFALTVVATILMCANMAKAQVVTEGLVSYWTFDKADIDGDTAKDVWGKNDGTIMGPKIVEGKIGEALEFDGSDDSVDCGNDKSLDITDEMTHEAWVKLNSFQTIGGNCRITNKGISDTEVYTFLIDVGDGTPTFYIYVAGQSHGVQGEPLSLNKWYYLVGTYDGDNLKIYIDGELSNTLAQSGEIDTSAGSLAIGSRPEGGARVVNGIIDEVRIYSRALTEEEVKQNMNAEGLAIVSPITKLSLSWGEIKVSR